MLRNKTLALFFTTGVSLKLWHDIGMIDREVAIYNELSQYFERIFFFTYGKEDLEFKDYLASNIVVVPKRGIDNNLLYSFLLPFIHYRTLKKADVLKTNQMFGSWSAVLTKLICRKKLAVRTGFTLSIHFSSVEPRTWLRLLSRNCERFAYRIADAAITSSQGDFSYVEQNYHPRRHIFIPNYVETDVFKPMNREKKKGSICFIGRLTKQKNLFALLEALKGLPYTIDLIGAGEQEEQLREFVNKNAINANFLGNVPNHELPGILNEHEIFVLPSLWEGMPKTLLEAMACELPVVGTNIDGTREVIKHGENGILCDTDSNSIREAIIGVIEDEGLKQRLGKKARKTVEQRFSLEKLTDKELGLYTQLLAKEVVARNA